MRDKKNNLRTIITNPDATEWMQAEPYASYTDDPAEQDLWRIVSIPMALHLARGDVVSVDSEGCIIDRKYRGTRTYGGRVMPGENGTLPLEEIRQVIEANLKPSTIEVEWMNDITFTMSVPLNMRHERFVTIAEKCPCHFNVFCEPLENNNEQDDA